MMRSRTSYENEFSVFISLGKPLFQAKACADRVHLSLDGQDQGRYGIVELEKSLFYRQRIVILNIRSNGKTIGKSGEP